MKLHIVLLMASTALAFLSWRYVETPFRKRWICQTRPKIFTFAGVSMGMSLLLGLLVHYQAGFPARISTEALSYAKSRNHRAFHNNVTLEQAMSGQFVELGSQATTQPISVLIWGDSHAMAVTPILDDLCHRFFRRGIQATHSSTAPILEYVSPGFWSLKEDSPAFNRSVLTFISRNRVQKVIIAAAWNRYPASNSFKTGLVSTVRAIQDLGVRVYVLKDVPNPGFDVPRLVAATAMHNGDLEQLGLSREQFDISNRDLGQTFEQVAQMGATVLDPSNYFLNHKGVYGVVHNGQILYCDEQHLTVEGSRLLLPLFESIFRSE